MPSFPSSIVIPKYRGPMQSSRLRRCVSIPFPPRATLAHPSREDAMAAMKIGLMFANSGPFSNPDLFAHLVTTADKVGVESIWTVEHVVIPQGYKSPYPYSNTGKIPGGEDV